MTFCDNLFYWLHFGPFKRGFRFLARRCLAGCNRILLGPAHGCIFKGADLPYRLGIYEIHVQRALVRVLKSDSVFYDVGANVGFFSLLGAKLVGDGGVVIAFEPSGDNGLALRSLCAANGVPEYPTDFRRQFPPPTEMLTSRRTQAAHKATWLPIWKPGALRSER